MKLSVIKLFNHVDRIKQQLSGVFFFKNKSEELDTVCLPPPEW